MIYDNGWLCTKANHSTDCRQVYCTHDECHPSLKASCPAASTADVVYTVHAQMTKAEREQAELLRLSRRVHAAADAAGEVERLKEKKRRRSRPKQRLTKDRNPKHQVVVRVRQTGRGKGR